MKKFSILQGIAVTYCDDRPAAKRILVQFTAQNLQFTYVHKTSVLHFYDFFRIADSVRVITAPVRPGRVRLPGTLVIFFEATDAAIKSGTLLAHVIFGRPFVKRFALCYQTVVCLSCLSCPVLSVCNVRALWSNGWTDQGETWHTGRTRPWRLCVRWGPRSPSPKGGRAPQIFGPFPLWPKGWTQRLDASRCHLVWR